MDFCLPDENLQGGLLTPSTAPGGSPTVVCVANKWDGIDSLPITHPLLIASGVIVQCPSTQIAYGTTENSPVTFQSFMDDALDRRVSTVGKALPFIEVSLRCLLTLLMYFDYVSSHNSSG